MRVAYDVTKLKFNSIAIDSSIVGSSVNGRQVVSWNAHRPSGCHVFSQVLNPLLSCQQLFLQHTASSAAISCGGLPALNVNIQSFHVVLADISVAQLGSANRS